MRRTLFRIVAVGLCLLATGSIIVELRAQAMLTIYLNPKYIGSGDTRVIEVFDVHCNVNRGQHSLTGGGARVPVRICKKPEYWSIKYRNVTNNGDWVEVSLLSDGDEVSP